MATAPLLLGTVMAQAVAPKIYTIDGDTIVDPTSVQLAIFVAKHKVLKQVARKNALQAEVARLEAEKVSSIQVPEKSTSTTMIAIGLIAGTITLATVSKKH